MKNKFTNIPVTFNKVESIDSRFVKLKITLMHLGENFNGSYFDKEVVERAIPTLANTPILGFIEEDVTGEKDFSDHRMEIVKDENGYKTKYLGSAYGVIPEDNNARFENIVGSDGVERTYLVCDGLMWTKFDESTDIINGMTYRNQSMELDEDYDGELDRNTGLFHFTRFKFYGACILSNSVEPAMINAKVEKMFSTDFMAQIQKKMEEFKLSYSEHLNSLDNKEDSFTNKEGEKMGEKLLELLAKYSLTEEVLEKFEFKLENFETELGMEAELVRIAEAIAQEKEQVDEVKPEGEDLEDKKIVEDALKELEATVAELTKKLGDKTAEHDDLKAEYEAVKAEFENLVEEVKELKEFKATTLAKERQDQEDALFEQFAGQLTEEEMNPVKEVASTMELADIETALYALVGKKTAKFSKHGSKEKEVVKVEFSRDGRKEDVTGYEYILEKHLK